MPPVIDAIKISVAQQEVSEHVQQNASIEKRIALNPSFKPSYTEHRKTALPM
jgi:hypothetical protein